MIDVVVIEDQKTIRESLAALLSGTDGYRCIGAYDSCEKFLPLLDDLVPDVILMDIGLNGMSGIEGVKQIRKIFTDATILMLTIHKESDLVFEALCAGACGYLAKPTPPTRLLEKLHLPMEYRQHLYFIFKEALNNSLKHSGCTMITLSAAVNGSAFQIHLKDNGAGFEHEQSRGNGLANMTARAKKIGGRLDVASSFTSGTSVQFDGAA